MVAWRRIRPCRKQRYGAYSRKLTDIWNRIKRKKKREEKGERKEGTNKRTPKALPAIDPGELREKASVPNKQLSRMNKAEEKQPPKLQEDYLPRLEKYESQSEKLKRRHPFGTPSSKWDNPLLSFTSGEPENSLSPILPLYLSTGPENQRIPSPLFYHFVCHRVRRIGEFPLPYPTTLFVDGSEESENSLSPILPLYLLPGPEKWQSA